MILMSTRVAIETAITLLGGPVKAARDLGAPSYQAVQQWLITESVPAEYCPKIESLLDGAITCEQLRPSVDWAYVRRAGRRRKAVA